MFDNDQVPQNEENFQDVGQESVPQVEQVAVDSPATPQAAPQESNADRNFRALREKAERLEREKEDYARQLNAYQQQAQPRHQEEQETEDNLAPDALIEKRHLSRYDKKIQKLESQLKEYQAASSNLSAENQLKTKYPDFDTIVNKDNLEMLKLTYPELAQTLYNNPDLYTKGSAAYTIIKQMGIAPGSSNDADRQRAIDNANKPRPLASVSASQGNNSPLQRANAFANGLTEELRTQLHKEMIESMRNL